MLSERKKNGGLHSLSMTFVRKAACDKGKPSPRPRRKKPKTMPAAKDWMSHQLMRDTNGDIVKCKPEFSEWFTNYVSVPNLKNKRFHLKFRHRFRMQHSSFLTLLDWVKESKAFKKWTKPKHNGPHPPSPVELLLLGTLCCVGRGWTFDNLQEQTSIS